MKIVNKLSVQNAKKFIQSSFKNVKCESIHYQKLQKLFNRGSKISNVNQSNVKIAKENQSNVESAKTNQSNYINELLKITSIESIF